MRSSFTDTPAVNHMLITPISMMVSGTEEPGFGRVIIKITVNFSPTGLAVRKLLAPLVRDRGFLFACCMAVTLYSPYPAMLCECSSARSNL